MTTYIPRGNNAAEFLFVNRHDSYLLENLLWCDENWGYFFDDLIVNEGIVVYPLEIFPIWKNTQQCFKT
jgi:hypothetical protein